MSAGDPPESVELAPKPRTVLALLVANAGRLIPVSSLVREVWNGFPPASALRNIQTYVFQSRKVLTHITGMPLRVVGQELLLTRPGGYMFSDSVARFDHRRYLELAEHGRTIARTGSVGEGVETFSRALALWRGSALVDTVTGPSLEAQRRHLEESRLGVVETLCANRISLGHYHEALSDLSVSVSEHPLHEGLHLQYMRVLDIIGARAQALEVFNRLRFNLVAELGIEPGAPVQRLQQRILNATDTDTDTDRTAPHPPTGMMTPVVR
ncbi:AfsR/SARP family transcriptional regulator [Streptomyces sp. NBC_01433]|nr:AfsR/SARP family transcriptional regulator [Streptomyces sp. NBC_01433]